MKISVCIPTFNRPVLLERAILSVIEQDCEGVEILIGDDGNSDKSSAIVLNLSNKFHVNIKHIVNNPAFGQGKNVNNLFCCASGEYLLLLHDDDYLLPGALKSMVCVLDDNMSAAICFGKQKIVTEQGVFLHGIVEKYDDLLGRVGNLSPMHSAILGQFPNAGYLIRRSCLPPNAYVKASLYLCACDYAFGLIFAAASKVEFVVIHDFTYAYCLTAGSSARSTKTSNSQAIAYLINKSLVSDPVCCHASAKWLYLNSRTCIKSAADHGHSMLALQWFFEKYHRPYIFTLGGVNRLYMCFKSIISIKKFQLPPDINATLEKSP